MNGISASSGGPSLSKPKPRSSNIHHSSVSTRQGSTSSIAAVRWSCRSWVSTRPATANRIRAVMPARRLSTSVRNACLDVCGAGAARAGRRGWRRRAAGPRASAAAGRSAPPRPSRGWRRTPSSPASASRWNSAHRSRRSTGSSPTVGSSRTSRSGLAEQGDRQRDPRALPAGEPVDHLVSRCVREVDRLDAAIHLGGRHAEHPREEPQVLLDGEVVVHAGCLGDVADPVAQLAAPAGTAEHASPCRLDDLHADDAAHQAGLAAAGRPEQAVTWPGGTVKVTPSTARRPPRTTWRSRTSTAADAPVTAGAPCRSAAAKFSRTKASASIRSSSRASR